MPANPDNAANSDNCEEARRNLVVALKGSPLISAKENQAIVRQAIKNFCILCNKK